MNFLKKAAFCYVAPLLSICSMTTTPLQAQCCDPEPCIDWCSLLVPALVGAASGAATAAAIKNRGKRGKRGEQGEHGPRGPLGPRGTAGVNPFLENDHQSIKFSFEIFNLTTSELPSDSSEITAFISSPDGKIITTRSFDFDSSSSDGFAYPSPVYGTYTVGFEFDEHPSSVTFDYRIVIDPSDREQTVFEGTQTLPASSSLVQFSFDFTYGPCGTMPTGSCCRSSSSSS